MTLSVSLMPLNAIVVLSSSSCLLNAVEAARGHYRLLLLLLLLVWMATVARIDLVMASFVSRWPR